MYTTINIKEKTKFRFLENKLKKRVKTQDKYINLLLDKEEEKKNE